MTLSEFLALPGAVEHDGGPSPVPLDSKPSVMFGDGKTCRGIPARNWIFPAHKKNFWIWSNAGPASIIAYIPEKQDG